MLWGCQVLCGVCGGYPLLMVGSGSGFWLEACLPPWAGSVLLLGSVVLSGGRDPAVPKAVRGGGAVAGSGSPPAERQWVPPRTCLPDSSGYHSRWPSRRHAPRRRCTPRRRGFFFGSSIGLPRREAPAGSPTEMSEGGPGNVCGDNYPLMNDGWKRVGFLVGSVPTSVML